MQIHVTGEAISGYESKSGDKTVLIAVLVSIIVVLLTALATSVVILQKMSGDSLTQKLFNKEKIEVAILDEN